MKLWVGHESETHKHALTHAHGHGKLYMPFRHFMAGGIKTNMIPSKHQAIFQVCRIIEVKDRIKTKRVIGIFY